MLQETAARVRSEGFLPPLPIANSRHGTLVHEQLAAIGVTPLGLILEPFGRNTAAVGVIAAEWATRHAPGTLVLLAPADHVIADGQRFRGAVAHAADIATRRIVTFGIALTGPDTGYGYIQSGESIDAKVFAVRRSLLWSDGPSISVIGVEDLVVIAAGDHVLVLPRNQAQDVRKIVEMRKARGS